MEKPNLVSHHSERDALRGFARERANFGTA